MSTRNRALRAIEDLVAAKERAVLTMAPEWAKGFGGDLNDPDELAFVRAIEAMGEARSLLAQATGNGVESAPLSLSGLPR